MDTSGRLPILSGDDPLFQVAEYSSTMAAALNPAVPSIVYANGWAPFGGGYRDLTFHKMGRMVFVMGMIKPGTLTTGVIAAYIPSHLIPIVHHNQGVTTSGGSPTYQSNSIVQFSTDGAIKLFTLPAATSYVMFNNCYLLD